MERLDFRIISYNRQKGNFGPVKNKKINEAVEDFFRRVRATAPQVWEQSDVPFGTGKLSSEAFGVGRVKKTRGPGGTEYSIDMGVKKVKTSTPLWAGSPGEAFYPKFVQEGTIGKKIEGTNMPIRDSKRKIRKVQRRDKKGRFGKKQNLYKNSVKGQVANPYMDRFGRGMGIATRGYKGALTRRIGNIIKE
jgi:hypothetical protein